jgi:hypothetical protein
MADTSVDNESVPPNLAVNASANNTSISTSTATGSNGEQAYASGEKSTSVLAGKTGPTAQTDMAGSSGSNAFISNSKFPDRGAFTRNVLEPIATAAGLSGTHATINLQLIAPVIRLRHECRSPRRTNWMVPPLVRQRTPSRTAT